jgi:hypothetical protein
VFVVILTGKGTFFLCFVFVEGLVNQWMGLTVECPCFSPFIGFLLIFLISVVALKLLVGTLIIPVGCSIKLILTRSDSSPS